MCSFFRAALLQNLPSCGRLISSRTSQQQSLALCFRQSGLTYQGREFAIGSCAISKTLESVSKPFSIHGAMDQKAGNQCLAIQHNFTGVAADDQY